MATRVKFQPKGGKDVKNMERPLAMRLQSRKLGKIVGDQLTTEQEAVRNAEAVKAREAELDKREKALEGREKKVLKDAEKLNKK